MGGPPHRAVHVLQQLTDDEYERLALLDAYEAAGLAREGVGADLFARLTDVQVREIYQHPADHDTGRLIPPRPPVRTAAAAAAVKPEDELTLEEELSLAEAAMRKYGVPEDQIPLGLELIRRKRGEAE